jgi:hypothetical protein
MDMFIGLLNLAISKEIALKIKNEMGKKEKISGGKSSGTLSPSDFLKRKKLWI